MSEHTPSRLASRDPALAPFLDRVTVGDCIKVMQRMPSNSIDLALTDPPYLVRYRSRDGRTIKGDGRRQSAWLKPAMAEVYRVLKPDTFFVSFYGWTRIDEFMGAWRDAGFRPVGHIVFTKRYASGGAFLQYRHESAFLLAKGEPLRPATPPADVLPFPYSGNRHHPTEKHPQVWEPLIRAFSKPGQVILDPFAGSASSAVAAKRLEREFIAIELDSKYASFAARRLG